MPDMETAAVRAWLQEHDPRVLDIPEVAVRPVEEQPDVSAALERWGAALDAALQNDAQRVSSLLRSDPARGETRRVIAQLGHLRTNRLLGWMLKEGLPESQEIVAGLLVPDEGGTSQYLQTILVEADRPNLLTRLFADERLAVLLLSCQQASALKEAA